jgi:hypothetical protein
MILIPFLIINQALAMPFGFSSFKGFLNVFKSKSEASVVPLMTSPRSAAKPSIPQAINNLEAHRRTLIERSQNLEMSIHKNKQAGLAAPTRAQKLPLVRQRLILKSQLKTNNVMLQRLDAQLTQLQTFQSRSRSRT